MYLAEGALETGLRHCANNANGMQKYEIIESKWRDTHCVAVVKRCETMFVA